MNLGSQTIARKSPLSKLIGALYRGFFYYGMLASLMGLAVYFIAAGSYLVFLGGSAYYVLSGLWLGLISYFFLRRRRISVLLLFVYFLVTWAWAIIEVGGLSGWLLLPRVNVVSGMMIISSLPIVLGQLKRDNLVWTDAPAIRALLSPRPYLLGSTLAVIALMSLGVVLSPMDEIKPGEMTPAPAKKVGAASISPTAANEGEWHHFGRTLSATRFSPLQQITPQNASKLTKVWEYKEPDPPLNSKIATAIALDAPPGRKDEATPLMIGDKVFVCTPTNIVFALDAEDGHLVWRHDPQVNSEHAYWQTCRGLAYYEQAASASCPRRILTATTDARMIALNADTGVPCADFGHEGEISLKDGLGDVEPGVYYTTSPPTVVAGVAVVGAWIADNRATDEPSGVVRAFDATTGKLAWAWDMGRPEWETGAPKPGETYTRGTPNAWSIFSADEALGLVYIPTGNATPDFVGSYRKPEWEKYSSSLVAIDVTTGRVRWSFQTVHHDLWDYDVAAQPVLTDLSVGTERVPVVVEATKRGDIFVLDRRNGRPIYEVTEKSAPKTDVTGEWTAATQPYSTGMPSLSGPTLHENEMWGISPIDQLLCRIKFRKFRYDGPMTPPSLRGSIEYPGTVGGVNWASVSIDEDQGLLITQSMRLAFVIKLFERKSPDDEQPKFSHAQKGTPFRATSSPLQSRLYVPCQQPPFGLLTAIDLEAAKIVWQKPFGTAENSGPLDFKSHLPITMGSAPVVGGAITTRGGLTIIGAATDRRLRAIDSLSGTELWNDRLPEGNQATPITYLGPRTHKQLVAIVSGGHVDLQRNLATHVVAYGLAP
jgi:membrane-bound PQQ-dependent dehydrogenase (glucose/quinate/shikimate family)